MRHMSTRSYEQYCPIAVALDVLGDRWALLILRELSMGDKRFTDLKEGLAGIAPNLLADRLRELEAAGLVGRKELPPPAARSVYTLTPEGRDAFPVLRSLARFGASRMAGPRGQSIRPAMAVYGMLTPWFEPDGGPPFHVRLVLDGEPFDLLVDGERLTQRVGDRSPDLELTGSARAFVDVRQGRKQLVDVLEHGALRQQGSARARARFERLFGLART
jgi:DNA-binding HxlR family transcriptional regulator